MNTESIICKIKRARHYDKSFYFCFREKNNEYYEKNENFKED